MEKQGLPDQVGGSMPTSPLNLQVKWEIPHYLEESQHEEFLHITKSLISPKQLIIEKIKHSTANNFVLHHHYLRRKCYIARNVSYGVYFGEYLVGVCMYGMPVWRSYPDLVPPLLNKEVPELIRLSLLDCCPKNSASRVIGLTSKFLTKDWEADSGVVPKLIFTMADEALGFSGHIYLASGFKFLKRTMGRASNPGGTHGKWQKNKDKTKAAKLVFIKEL